MHEEVLLSCVFGCVSHKDKLEHYLECSVLWSLIDEVFLTSIGSSMLARCNISNPCESSAIMLTTAFNMYHTIKGGHRNLITASASSGRYGPVCKVALDVARLYHSRYNMYFNIPHSSSVGALRIHPQRVRERDIHTHSSSASAVAMHRPKLQL